MAIKSDKRNFDEGTLESIKFDHLRDDYYQGIDVIKNAGYTPEDYMHDFTCFIGHFNMIRFISLYECYQKTLGISGHIADVGVDKGASSLAFAKLINIYEATSLTQVHGFDWFEGNKEIAQHKTPLTKKKEVETLAGVKSLVQAQNLDHIVRLHKLDLTQDLDGFFEKSPHLQFKLVYLDTGTYESTKAALSHFWPRLHKGGILILDQYNFEITKGETQAVVEFFADKNQVVRTFQHGWMPTAYIIKE